MAWVEAMIDDLDDTSDGEFHQGVIDSIDDGVATVLVGESLVEWDFPAHLLPPEARENTVLRLRVADGSYEVIDIDPSMKPLEERIGRGLNRKRPIVFPLPHRDHVEPPAELPVLDDGERASRKVRDLNRP
jgi:hypothetical protein